MKKLRNGFFLIITMFCASAAFGQKCNFDVDKKDDFTNEHVRSTKIKIGNFFYSWWVLMEQKGSRYYMTVQSAATGKIDDVIPKGSKVFFKLDNGNVVDMNVVEDCVPNHNVQNNVIVTMWLPKGELTKDAMQKLSESPTSLIRMNIGGKDFDSPEAKGKEGKKMMTTALCMLTAD